MGSPRRAGPFRDLIDPGLTLKERLRRTHFDRTVLMAPGQVDPDPRRRIERAMDLCDLAAELRRARKEA